MIRGWLNQFDIQACRKEWWLGQCPLKVRR
jgi:hypothetical protein